MPLLPRDPHLLAGVKLHINQFFAFQITVTVNGFIKIFHGLFNLSGHMSLHMIFMSNKGTGNFVFDKRSQQSQFHRFPMPQETLVLPTTELFRNVTTTVVFMYIALVRTTDSVIIKTKNKIILSLQNQS
jgi:hypothetical protein